MWIILFSGQTGTLKTEINTRIDEKKAWKLILPGGSLGPEGVQTKIGVEVTANFSKVSIITMLAPSPDWFVGIDSLDMCDNGTWRESVNVTMLPPYDAGTEEGLEFKSTDVATNPHVNIFEITNNTDGAFKYTRPIPSLGEFRFQKTDSLPPTDESTPGTPTENSVGKATVNFVVFATSALVLKLF